LLKVDLEFIKAITSIRVIQGVMQNQV